MMTIAALFPVYIISELVTGRARLGLISEEIAMTWLIFLQGAGSMVLSQFPTKYDPQHLFFKNPDIFTNLCIPIVLITLVFSFIIAPRIATRQLKPRSDEEEVVVNG